jgi:threonine/homoserine/homoserine lactone efflux protein
MEPFLAPFFKGTLAGLIVTTPVGPICILCIQRSLAQGKMSGIATGLGSAIALALYGTLGFAGVGFLSQGCAAMRLWLLVAGAVVLCILGLRILRSSPQITPPENQTAGFFGNALLTFFLELVNPASIMIFFGLFVSMQHTSISTVGYAAVGLGIFLSSMIWWIFLATVVASFRKFFTPLRLLWLNRLAGVFIIFLGLRPFIPLLLRH